VNQPTIFVVDDDEAVREALRSLLESFGMAVEEYGSTADFARHYRPRSCDCLLLDHHLPGTTGLDFLTSSKAQLNGLPVILMTGRGDSGMRSRAERLGVSAYLEKPIESETLLAEINRALGSGEERGDGATRSAR